MFLPASTYKDRCVAPRSGVDSEGDAYTDVAGTLGDELFWLRSWTQETYLWNREVIDQDPNGFSTPQAYFGELKTLNTTSSGKLKDEFHFSMPTVDYLADVGSEAQAGYGMSLVAYQNTPPRDLRVRYTEPNSPASDDGTGTPPIRRGARILSIDGVDLVNDNTNAGIDVLNAGLFPTTVGESHDFVFDYPGEGAQQYSYTFTSADLVFSPVNRTQVIDTSSGKVGYLLLNSFSEYIAEEQLYDAVNDLAAQNINDLVLDLRYNGGGLLVVASQLAYMIAGDQATSGKTFEALKFNDDAGNSDPVFGGANEPFPFIDTGVGFSLPNGVPLPTLDLDRVFIMSTGGTCSASEAVINGLRGVDVEVILVGDTTCGKPYGFDPTDNCSETYFTIQFQGVNDKGFGDYADGFTPANTPTTGGVRVAGCSVADIADGAELGDASETLLSAALGYRDNGACPAATVVSSSIRPADARKDEDALSLKSSSISPKSAFLRNNRIVTRP